MPLRRKQMTHEEFEQTLKDIDPESLLSALHAGSASLKAWKEMDTEVFGWAIDFKKYLGERFEKTDEEYHIINRYIDDVLTFVDDHFKEIINADRTA